MGLGDRTYVLTANHEASFPSEVLYFDCETRFDPTLDEQRQPLRLGVAVRQSYRGGVAVGAPRGMTFRTADAFWDLVCGILRPRRSLWVIAHNLDFDFAAVEGFRALQERGFAVTFWAFAPYMFLIRAQRDRTTIQFCDSLGFMRTSLQSLGRRFGVEKGIMPAAADTEEAWERYCERDVEVLKVSFEALIAFVRDNCLGRLALTAPGQALTAYRHRFMSEKLILHRTPAVLPLELAAYHGGRTEAFFVGQVPRSPIFYLDVNAMYAAVMRAGSYPCQLLGTKLSPTPAQFRQALAKWEVLAECELDLPLPVVPVVRDKLLFPVGRFTATLAGPELRLCYDRGYVRQVRRMVCYRRGSPFRGYVDYFWELRQRARRDNDATLDWLGKLLLNSLYGKWGQRDPQYTVTKAAPLAPTGLETVVSSATGRKETRLTFAGQTWVKTGEEPSRWSSYPLAGWITSYARVRLWELIERAGREHVYYCDTDSLFVDQVGFDRLQGVVSASQLGALSLRSQGETLVIRGPKDYSLDDETALKGVPRKALRVGPSTYRYTTFERTRTRLRAGHPDAVMQRSVTKTLSRVCDKGILSPSGWVEPYELDEGSETTSALLPLPAA